MTTSRCVSAISQVESFKLSNNKFRTKLDRVNVETNNIYTKIHVTH